MLVSWYVALRHEFPTEMPPELRERGARIQFARWLVLNGLLSDWPTCPPEETAGELVGASHSKVA